MTSYSFDRGETISLALDCVEGDAAAATLTATLKRAIGGSPIPFAVAPRAAAGQIPAGWDLTISAEISAGLAPGIYQAVPTAVVGGGTIIGEPVQVQLK